MLALGRQMDRDSSQGTISFEMVCDLYPRLLGTLVELSLQSHLGRFVCRSTRFPNLM